MENPKCKFCETREHSRFDPCPVLVDRYCRSLADGLAPEPVSAPVERVQAEPAPRSATGPLTPAEKQRRYRERHAGRVREADRSRKAASRRGEPHT